MDDRRMTWEEIVDKYPDRWVGLTQIEWENASNVRSAVVLGSSQTGEEYLEKQLRGEDVVTIYTTPDNLGLLGIFGEVLGKRV